MSVWIWSTPRRAGICQHPSRCPSTTVAIDLVDSHEVPIYRAVIRLPRLAPVGESPYA